MRVATPSLPLLACNSEISIPHKILRTPGESVANLVSNWLLLLSFARVHPCVLLRLGARKYFREIDERTEMSHLRSRSCSNQIDWRFRSRVVLRSLRLWLNCWQGRSFYRNRAGLISNKRVEVFVVLRPSVVSVKGRSKTSNKIEIKNYFY